MGEPHLTVGLPVYNDPEGLRRTIPSVLGQTWRGPMRVLVVDDGSTDETGEVLESLAGTYGRIEVIRHRENLGRPYARNTVLDHAGDGYLAWCDSGDLWHPRKVELQLATLREAEDVDPDTPLLCTSPLRWVFLDRDDTRLRVPDVNGDQLYNALTGTLYPYLQGILGRAEHFRRIGGFDERLLRRQDYDFLVRFLAAGGRVVSTAGNLGLFTYLKSDVGTPAPVVATANQEIREKHRQLYRRYGRRLERRVRSNQHRLVARFYQHNGQLAQSLRYRALARLASPDLLTSGRRGARRVRSRAPGRLSRGTARTMARVLRPFAPVLRRPGVVALARRAGVLRIPGTARLGRAVSESRRRAGASAQPASSVETIDQLEAAATPGSAPEAWLQLEQAYRSRGMMHSAESALRRALELLPGDPVLRVRLIELLPLRKKWAECVALWDGRSSDDDAHLRGLTFARVARAFRETGDVAGALAVAEEGVRLWPHESRVWDEVYVGRSALIDWERAVAGSDLPPPAIDTEPAEGVVTDLGFLAGGSGPVDGRIAARPGEVPSISLVVNRVSVASTSATGAGNDGRWALFSLSAHELKQYLGDGDVVWVECDGRPVPIEGYGPACEVSTGYETRFPELRRKLRAGFVFTKFGAFRKGTTRSAKRQVLDLYEEVAAVLRESHGYRAYPFYGNLLGAVREHDLIGHDVGGFDMGYVSRHAAAQDVRAELVGICRTLLERGYYLVVQPWSVYVMAGRGSQIIVDLNYAWFNPGGELNLSYGWRYPPVTDRATLDYPRQSLIGGHLVDIPGNAEEILEQLYGPTWAVPDQGFDVDAGLKRDPEYLLSVEEMASVEQLDPDRVEARLDRHPDSDTFAG